MARLWFLRVPSRRHLLYHCELKIRINLVFFCFDYFSIRVYEFFSRVFTGIWSNLCVGLHYNVSRSEFPSNNEKKYIKNYVLLVCLVLNLLFT